MMKSILAVLAMSLIAGAAYAENNRQSTSLLERGIARIEHGLARLQAKLTGRPGSESSEGCSDMMSGGMAGGGGKSDSMMSGGGMMGGGRPNEQWRGSNAR